jgi:hypothetical protein
MQLQIASRCWCSSTKLYGRKKTNTALRTCNCGDYLLAHVPVLDFTVYTLGWTHSAFALEGRDEWRNPVSEASDPTQTAEKSQERYSPLIGMNIKFWSNVWKRGWSHPFPSHGAQHGISRSQPGIAWHEITTRFLKMRPGFETRRQEDCYKFLCATSEMS